MKYCPECGKKQEGKNDFCGKCGHKLTAKSKQKKKRPDSISMAVNIMYITLVVGFFNSIMVSTDEFFITLFSLGVTAFLTYMMGEGRNWARIVILIFLIVGIPVVVLYSIPALWYISPIATIVSIGITLAQLYALYLLFQKPASAWFDAMKG